MRAHTGSAVMRPAAASSGTASPGIGAASPAPASAVHQRANASVERDVFQIGGMTVFGHNALRLSRFNGPNEALAELYAERYAAYRRLAETLGRQVDK